MTAPAEPTVGRGRAGPVEPVAGLAEGRPALVWRSPAAVSSPWLAISSAPHGGGIGERGWVLNTTVGGDYAEPDPDAHLAALAAGLGLTGPGTGLLTAVDVRHAVRRADTGVVAWVTTGIGYPAWAAAPAEPAAPVGTINVVAVLPALLADGALVNAVATVAEAKAQALAEAGVPGTGTCTDATVLLCPRAGSAQPYGGPRSAVGSALARAVHAAVLAGLAVPDPRYQDR